MTLAVVLFSNWDRSASATLAGSARRGSTKSKWPSESVPGVPVCLPDGDAEILMKNARLGLSATDPAIGRPKPVRNPALAGDSLDGTDAEVQPHRSFSKSADTWYMKRSVFDADYRTVLTAYDHARMGLRASPDLNVARRHDLLSEMASKALDPLGVPPTLKPAAYALLVFAARSAQNAHDRAWATAALASAGIHPLTTEESAHVLRRAKPEPPLLLPDVATFSDTLSDWKIVPVASLPTWTPPAGCGHENVFQKTVTRARRLTLPRTRGRRTQLEVRRSFQHRLLTGRLDPCAAVHDNDLDVAAAMAAAITVWRETRPFTWTSARAAFDPTGSEPIPNPQAAFAWSFLREPIFWDGKTPELGNGHHRVCMLKLAGVADALVLVS